MEVKILTDRLGAYKKDQVIEMKELVPPFNALIEQGEAEIVGAKKVKEVVKKVVKVAKKPIKKK